MAQDPEQIGTPLRDAKTDPRPHDYLPPGLGGISPGFPTNGRPMGRGEHTSSPLASPTPDRTGPATTSPERTHPCAPARK